MVTYTITVLIPIVQYSGQLATQFKGPTPSMQNDPKPEVLVHQMVPALMLDVNTRGSHS